jgi:hypothetical protein
MIAVTPSMRPWIVPLIVSEVSSRKNTSRGVCSPGIESS